MRNGILFFLLAAVNICYAQPEKRIIYQKKLLQFSVTPGFGSNGLHPAGFINYFSLNLTSGYSAANELVEVGGVSNLNTDYTKGLQFAGLVNITGGNAFAAMFKKEIKKKEENGFEANLTGAQFSGLANIVVTNVFGLQVSGGINLTGNALFGLQIAGVSNVVKNYSFGVQIAGLYNSSVKSMDGIQLASLINFTQGQLQGMQMALINRAGRIEGKNSYSYSGVTALQVGLINRSAKMNGFQMGLINFGGTMQGTQIGLINFYRGGTISNTRNGTSIGLLNIGDSYNIQVYSDELFLTNYSLMTGTGKNLRMLDDTKSLYIENAVIFGYNPDLLRNDHTRWALGYGLYRMVYNRSVAKGMNQFRFISTGAEILHYNDGAGLRKKLNPLSRIKMSVGSRLHPRLFNLYVFAGITYNFLMSDTIMNVPYSFMKEISVKEDYVLQRWPGFHLGVMLH